MSTIIKDGTGSARSARVDSSNRLAAFATTQQGNVSAKKSGKAFIISSGLVTLTSANESALLYILTNETSDLVVDNIEIQLGQSDGTGDVIRTDYVVNTGGTLLSNAVVSTPFNLNVGASDSLDATVYRGVEGDTLVGIPAGAAIYQPGTIITQQSGVIIPKGSDIALSITPPAGNTSMKVVINVQLHLLDAE